tara:strand:+ start:218 stop:688 length:471 start_codon:yes stop_codon:yes gene_type:complete
MQVNVQIPEPVQESCKSLYKLKFTIGAIISGIVALILFVIAIIMFIKPGTAKVQKCMSLDEQDEYNQQNPDKQIGNDDVASPPNDSRCPNTVGRYMNVPSDSYTPAFICLFIAIICAAGAAYSWITRNNKAKALQSCVTDMRRAASPLRSTQRWSL